MDKSFDEPPSDQEPGDLPFSQLLDLTSVGRAGFETVLTLSPQDEEAVAEALGVLGIDGLSASVRVKPERKDIYLVRGKVKARLSQECVITLEPVFVAVDQEIDLRVRANAGQDAVDQAQRQELDFFLQRGPEKVLDLSAQNSRKSKAMEHFQQSIKTGNALNEADPPEPLVGHELDLGLILLEFLALGVDPYPRQEGASLEGSPYAAKTHPLLAGDEEAAGEETINEPARPSPFAALKAWRSDD